MYKIIRQDPESLNDEISDLLKVHKVRVKNVFKVCSLKNQEENGDFLRYINENEQLKDKIDILENKLKYKHLNKKKYEVRIKGRFDEPHFKTLKKTKEIIIDDTILAIDHFDEEVEKRKFFCIVDSEYNNHSYEYINNEIEEIYINGKLAYKKGLI